jgi:hypothetical protein
MTSNIGRKTSYNIPTDPECTSSSLFDNSQFLGAVLGIDILISVPDPRPSARSSRIGSVGLPHELVNV